jgi:hypothetical protein
MSHLQHLRKEHVDMLLDLRFCTDLSGREVRSTTNPWGWVEEGKGGGEGRRGRMKKLFDRSQARMYLAYNRELDEVMRVAGRGALKGEEDKQEGGERKTLIRTIGKTRRIML